MHRLDIELQTSRIFLGLVLFFLIGSLFIVVTLAIPLWLKCLAGILVLSYVGYILFIYILLKHKRSITRIHFQNDSWFVTNRLGKFTAIVCGMSTVTNLCSILRFKIQHEKDLICIIFRDAIPNEMYRKLRSYLTQS